jgi:hypothetical protein
MAVTFGLGKGEVAMIAFGFIDPKTQELAAWGRQVA